MKTIEELRSEFEENKLIKMHIRMYCVFNESSEEYQPKDGFKTIHNIRCEFVNGAWFIFQELKK